MKSRLFVFFEVNITRDHTGDFESLFFRTIDGTAVNFLRQYWMEIPLSACSKTEKRKIQRLQNKLHLIRELQPKDIGTSRRNLHGFQGLVGQKNPWPMPPFPLSQAPLYDLQLPLYHFRRPRVPVKPGGTNFRSSAMTLCIQSTPSVRSKPHFKSLPGWACGRLPRAIPSPLIHQPSPLLKKIATPIGPLNFILDRMCERHFDYFRGKVRLLCSPIPERGSKAVDGEPWAQAAQKFEHCHGWTAAGPRAPQRTRKGCPRSSAPRQEYREPVRKEGRDVQLMPSCAAAGTCQTPHQDRISRVGGQDGLRRYGRRSGS